jgi:hypothetical protein
MAASNSPTSASSSGLNSSGGGGGGGGNPKENPNFLAMLASERDHIEKLEYTLLQLEKRNNALVEAWYGVERFFSASFLFALAVSY